MQEIRYDGKKINLKRKQGDIDTCKPDKLYNFPFWRELFFEDFTEGDYYGFISNHTTYSFDDGFVTLPGDSSFEISYSDLQHSGHDYSWTPPGVLDEEYSYDNLVPGDPNFEISYSESQHSQPDYSGSLDNFNTDPSYFDFESTGPDCSTYDEITPQTDWTLPSRNKNMWANMDTLSLWSMVCNQILIKSDDHLKTFKYLRNMHEYAKSNPGITIEDICSATLILNDKSLENSMDKSLTAKSKKKKIMRKNLIRVAVS